MHLYDRHYHIDATLERRTPFVLFDRKDEKKNNFFRHFIAAVCLFFAFRQISAGGNDNVARLAKSYLK